jgi:hypothetical protein
MTQAETNHTHTTDTHTTDTHKDPHLHDEQTGTKEGVPHGVTQEESKGVPDSGRHATESVPIHEGAGKDQAKDI